MTDTTAHPRLTDRIRPLAAPPSPLDHLGLEEYPLDALFQDVLRQVADVTDWEDTEITRDCYLDASTRIVETAASWRDDKGAVIDPIDQIEAGQTSPRFVSSAAILLAFGRTPALTSAAYESMEWCCRRLAEGKAASPDFWMRELATAYLCFEEFANPADLSHWSDLLQQVVPEKTYSCVDPEGSRLETLNNWVVYSSAGEVLRETAGLMPRHTDGVAGFAFFDKYMSVQWQHFTALGMYRDPGDPFTYDITTRLQIATALALGYAGPQRPVFNELLRRGALTQLLYLSPDGYVPYGGRSSQYLFQEAIITALCELEARRYASTQPRLAGIFKRQAHLSFTAILRWLEMLPFRNIKNGFPPDDCFGFDSYGRYSVYSLLISSFLGLAALYADDSIQEHPCPSETGTYLLHLAPAFHKIFASCCGTQVEIDTAADLGYDATGFGRFSRKGVPLELLGMPFSARPHHQIPEEFRPAQPLSINPEWLSDGRWQRLAALSEGITSKCRVTLETASTIGFIVTYALPDGTGLHESYCLAEYGMCYAVTITLPANQRPQALRLLIPVLHSDGSVAAEVDDAYPGRVAIKYRGASVMYRFDADLSQHWIADKIANRHGLFQTLQIESAGASLALAIERPK